jgi:short-subunit dehydrogenase
MEPHRTGAAANKEESRHMGTHLNGKIAIVTGASSGVGWAAAEKLAEQGVRLCITARREGALEELASNINRSGGECIAVPADTTSDDQVRQVVEECLRHYGKIDILVNAASVQSYAYFADYRLEEIHRVMNVNLYGYLRFARAVLPHLQAQRSGTIINVASMLSKGAAPLLSAYVASKHAILGWSESLRLELHGSGVDVSAILLPSVSTPMFEHAPTHHGYAPRPVPPVYDTYLAGRAVVKMAKSPKPQTMPAFIQGPVFMIAQKLARPLTDFVMGRWGARIQTRKAVRVNRPEGNLYRPVEEGTGPYGSVPPTPLLLRTAGAAALLAGLGAVALGAAMGARRLMN